MRAVLQQEWLLMASKPADMHAVALSCPHQHDTDIVSCNINSLYFSTETQAQQEERSE